jgi:hypothetical protein
LQGAIVTGGKWTINFPSTCTATNPCVITLTNPLPPITSKSSNPLILTIDGGEFGDVIIDGGSGSGNKFRAFFVDDAKVMLANLQIQNALAQGGAGGHGDWLGGGGGAGLGAGAFVNQSTANLSVQNTYFLNCQVVGGAGGTGNNDFFGGGSGGGGGMAYDGGNTNGGRYNGAGGGGILAVGNGGASFHGGDGGAGGGGGGGVDDQVPFEDTPYTTNGGSAYGHNSAGNPDNDNSSGSNGGFGGGGGGAAAYLDLSNLLIYAADGGNGGFGGGGGGGSESGTSNLGGFGGGNGGGTYDNVYGGAGGSAYGPSIFNNTGTVTIGNSGYLNDSNHFAATAGQGASGSGNAALSGGYDTTAAYNHGGTISGGTPNGSLPSALPATHFSVSISPGSFVLNQTATITVTALDPNNNPTIAYNNTANLTATDGDNRPITISPTSLTFTNGVATSSAMTLSIADTDITVTATDANWAYITGTSGDITVIKITPKVTVTLSSGTNPMFTKNAITFTASVGFGSGGNTGIRAGAQPMGISGYVLAGPTGTVTFMDGSTTLCSNVALGAYNSGTGVATTTCTVNSATAPLTVGSHSITAVYSGDANFYGITSNPYTQAIADFAFAMQNLAFTVIPGRAAVYTFTVTPISPSTTFPAGINLSFSGLPAGASAIFSPISIGSCASSCSTTVTLTIQTLLGNTTYAKTDPNAGGTFASRLAPFSLALLLLPFVGRLRKAGRRFSRMLPILLLLIAGMAAMAGMSGCNSTIGFFGQAQQSYTVGVTGTSGTLSHTSNVTLTVE